MPKSKAKKAVKTKTTPYDVAEHLRTPEEMAAYLDAWLEEAPDDAAGIAEALGNTPAVCRKSYINPVVFEAWRDKVVERLVPCGALSPSRLEKVALALLRERERH